MIVWRRFAVEGLAELQAILQSQDPQDQLQRLQRLSPTVRGAAGLSGAG